ncbi:Os07g0515150 [Oryza sativa Japonica Group]|uniref:Os07g0515150 protein n=1 Tax=Oryza sativa subsp. japonica TaxID=39947 RepID=A0A0P0X697_ORYSJ|nr:hypothetical protein EE612_039559 [Oryza sativa]BAT01750.1 Os07g0515150 [Oryza sativa Japonica Group]
MLISFELVSMHCGSDKFNIVDGSIADWCHTASINCFTSASESFDPSLANPALSSSYVMVPLLSVSMFVNICFRPLISSSLRFEAITCIYNCLLFIALNCFILERTALSIGLSDASPSLSQGSYGELGPK